MQDHEQKAAIALDWWIRCYLGKYLQLAGLHDAVNNLAGLRQIKSLDDASGIGSGLQSIENTVTDVYNKLAVQMGMAHIDSMYKKVNDAIDLADQGKLTSRAEINEYVLRVKKLVRILTDIRCLSPEKIEHLGKTAEELTRDLDTRL